MFKVQAPVPCFKHGEHHIVEIPDELRQNFDEWNAGVGHIQDKLGALPSEVREILITGTCDEAWNKLFPPEEEDD